MITNSHHGKIGRLPLNLRNELNRRLENGESAGPILAWLNALPDVQTILKPDFGGSPINAQNLSNWRKGGYQEWLKQQERRHLVRELTENAGELAAEAESNDIANHLSTILVAQFAASAQAILKTISDPVERCAREQEFLAALARVRRQDYLAGKLALDREKRAKENAEEMARQKEKAEYQRDNAHWHQILTRSVLGEMYSCPDLAMQTMAIRQSETLLRNVNTDPPASKTVPENPQSN